MREGLSVAEIHAITQYDPWFLERIKEIVDVEEEICRDGLPREAPDMRRLKAMGFSDRRLAELALKSANIRGEGVKTRARSHGLIHDAVKAMIGATTEDEVRAAAPPARRPAGVQAHRHLRRRVRGEDALHVLDLRGAELRRARGREPAQRPAQDRHPRRRAEPDRAGDRVRLLLLPRLLRARSKVPGSRRS